MTEKFSTLPFEKRASPRKRKSVDIEGSLSEAFCARQKNGPYCLRYLLPHDLFRKDGSIASVGDVIVGVDGSALHLFSRVIIQNIFCCPNNHTFDIITLAEWKLSQIQKRRAKNTARMKSADNRSATATRMKSEKNRKATAMRNKSVKNKMASALRNQSPKNKEACRLRMKTDLNKFYDRHRKYFKYDDKKRETWENDDMAEEDTRTRLAAAVATTRTRIEIWLASAKEGDLLPKELHPPVENNQNNHASLQRYPYDCREPRKKNGQLQMLWPHEYDEDSD